MNLTPKKLFYVTLVVSIVVQLITGIIEFGAYFVKVPSQYLLIRQLLTIELVVQFLEGMFYVWLAYNFTQVVNVTPKRYIDWAITTPSMLVTLMLYLIYLEKRQENNTNKLELVDLLQKNKGVIVPVLVLNWLMLLFGYLGEMRVIPVFVGVFLGFIPFLIYYYLIYTNYVTPTNTNGYWMFWYFFCFWALYGVVAVLPYYIKNACYNILDLFAKNFFGLFLSYLIFSGNY
jgi:hypothetical protein